MRRFAIINKKHLPWAGIVVLLFLSGCGGGSSVKPELPVQRDLARMRYEIQAGAFTNINNAVRLTYSLKHQNIQAYHFVDESGLFKVRFGNFATKEIARREANTLQSAGVIDVFYIVRPEDYSVSRYRGPDNQNLRQELLNTADRFIGVPYRWGGTSSHEGFDCSGLTMVVYRLNGLNLPRTSKEQWKVGRPVSRKRLAKGDLVFFSAGWGKKVSHVGIYTGNGKFLHAPSRGNRIQYSSLSNAYYKAHYVGARSYI